MRAHLADRVIDDIASDPHDDAAGAAVGQPGRARVPLDGRQAASRRGRSGPSLLHLLLDDWVGAALVSGYAVQHAAITLGIEEKLPAGTADNMAGICAGFAQDASLVPYARRNGTIPSVHGPVAPPLDADGDAHASNRCARTACAGSARLDLGPVDAGSADFDAHFRDSHVDGDGVETIVHEYTVDGLGGHVDANHHLGDGDRAGAAVAGVPRRHRKCGAGPRA